MYYILTTMLCTPLGTGDKGTSQAESLTSQSLESSWRKQITHLNMIHQVVMVLWRKIMQGKRKRSDRWDRKITDFYKIANQGLFDKVTSVSEKQRSKLLGISQWRTFQSEETASAKDLRQPLGLVCLAANYKFHFIHSHIIELIPNEWICEQVFCRVRSNISIELISIFALDSYCW